MGEQLRDVFLTRFNFWCGLVSRGQVYINVVQVMDLFFSTDVLMMLTGHFEAHLHVDRIAFLLQAHIWAQNLWLMYVGTLLFSVELSRAKKYIDALRPRNNNDNSSYV